MADRYWVGGAVNNIWNNAANWGSASNTRDSAGVPTSSDDVIFDGSANGNTACTIDVSPTIRTIDFTGGGGGGGNYTNTVTHNNGITITVTEATIKFNGSMTYTTGGSGRIWALNPSAGVTQTITSAGQTFPTVTITGADTAASVVFADTFLERSDSTLTHTGPATLNLNNQDATFGVFTSSGTTARTLTLGSGTLSLIGNSSVLNWTTSSNLTVTATTGTIHVNNTAITAQRLIVLGGKTINNLIITGGTNVFYRTLFNSAGTIGGTLVVNNVRNLQVAAVTLTITGAITNNGTVTAFNIMSSDATGTATLALAAASTVTWLAIGNITVTGAGSLTATNSSDLGGNTSVTITTPQSGGVIGG